jgi:hypothetical protein
VEFISPVSAEQKIVWMHSFLSKLGYSLPAPSLLVLDNQSAIQIAKIGRGAKSANVPDSEVEKKLAIFL